MKIIKGASGFGDTIYVRVIVEWLLTNRPDEYMVLTKYPNVFKDLDIKTGSYIKHIALDYDCQYIHDKTSKYSQFEDMLRRAKLPLFDMNTKLKNRQPTNTIIVIPPYTPMGGATPARIMKPLDNEFIKYISDFENIKFLAEQIDFFDLVDMFNSAKLVISQIGWTVPLAEMLDVPINVIFTRRALNSGQRFINTIKSHKIKTKETTKTVLLN